MSKALEKAIYSKDGVFQIYDSFVGSLYRDDKPPKEFDERVKELIDNMEELCSKYLLPISMSDYVKTQKGREMDDYTPKSIEVMHRRDELAEVILLKSRMMLAINARKLGAEVVTDVKASIARYYGFFSVHHIGAALIPRDKTKAFPREEIEEMFKKIEDCLVDKQLLSNKP